MSQTKKGEINESTIARIAGNIMSGRDIGVDEAVSLARRIAAEVRRTQPHPTEQD